MKEQDYIMKKYIAIILLMGWVGLVLFLSFQNGQDTADTSLKFTQKVLQIFMKGEPDWGILMLWDKRFRLAAHFVLLFLYGVISMLVLTEWIERLLIVTGISIGSGIFLAVMAEVGKLPIDGRHCDLLEMGLNVAGAVMGTVVVSMFYWLWQRNKDCS